MAFVGEAIVRRVDKRATQKMLKALRKEGELYDVNKLSAGHYEAKIKEGSLKGRLVFRALIGSHDYLVHMSKGLFTIVVDGKELENV